MSIELIEICKVCKNRSVSRTEGIICGLTQAKPDFIINCETYEEDPVQLKRNERHRKNYSDEEVNKESGMKALVSGLPLIAIGFFILFVPAPFFVAAIGLVCLIAGIVFVFYGVLRLATYKNTADKKKGIDSFQDDNEVI